MSEKAGAKDQAAYERAKAALRDAYLQGLTGLSLSGASLKAALLSDDMVGAQALKSNLFRAEYLRGAAERAQSD